MIAWLPVRVRRTETVVDPLAQWMRGQARSILWESVAAGVAAMAGLAALILLVRAVTL